MTNNIIELLDNEYLKREDLITLLLANKDDSKIILKKAADIKEKYVGNKVYLRGLIEYSNICRKNCYYCGIRASNKNTERYKLTDDEVLEAIDFALKNDYASIVIQSGERNDKEFTDTISALLAKIKQRTGGSLGITLSMGEQSEEIFKQWFELGATRYLLRIESSDRELYKKLHPDNDVHSYDLRINCLKALKKIGYQVGTGVMIGLPFQTIENLADDLIFFRDLDIDMCGMGPYIEHKDTPLYVHKDKLLPKIDRFNLTLKMVALLRIIMKDINIAATTAMQTIDPQGREKAIKVGSNVIMPNLTPLKYRENYLLYDEKPCVKEAADDCASCIESRVHIAGAKIGYGEKGDSPHFKKRME